MSLSKKESVLLITIQWAIMLGMFALGFFTKNIFENNFSFIYLLLFPFLFVATILIISLNAYFNSKETVTRKI